MGSKLLAEFVATKLSGSVLDLGAGGGSAVDPGSTLPLRALGCSMLCEADLHPATAAPGAHRVVIGSSGTLPFRDRAFTGVVCAHVLEHVAYPQRVLAEAARVLEPGGGLVVAVPNGYALSDRLFRWYFHLAHTGPRPEGSAHVQRFRLAALHELIEEAGFEVLETLPVEECFSWLHKHPLARAGMTRTWHALARGFGERFRYGWWALARRVGGDGE